VSQPPPEPTTGRLLARGGVLVVVGVWLTVGPLIRGTLDQDHLKWLPRWEMFGGWGRDICDVRYYTVDPDGTEHPLNWVDALGRSREGHDRRRNSINSNREAFRVGVKLCKALKADDVRARVRCGSRTRWRRREWMQHNMCSTEASGGR